MLVTEILERAMSLYPDKVGIVCGEEKFTYSRFGERVARMSSVFGKYGLERKDRIAILHRNCHYYLESYFSTLHAGLVLCPLNYRLSPGELISILNDTDAKILISEESLTWDLSAVARTDPTARPGGRRAARSWPR